MKIYSDDGKMFNSVEECEAYETELAVKKQKEEAERKAKEEKDKQLELFRNTKLKEINEVLQKASEMVDDYKKATGRKLTYTYDYIKGKFTVNDGTRNSIDFAWNNPIDDFFKAIYKK